MSPRNCVWRRFLSELQGRLKLPGWFGAALEAARPVGLSCGGCGAGGFLSLCQGSGCGHGRCPSLLPGTASCFLSFLYIRAPVQAGRTYIGVWGAAHTTVLQPCAATISIGYGYPCCTVLQPCCMNHAATISKGYRDRAAPCCMVI
jgi:hypothetical protein